MKRHLMAFDISSECDKIRRSQGRVLFFKNVGGEQKKHNRSTVMNYRDTVALASQVEKISSGVCVLVLMYFYGFVLVCM